MSPRRCLVTKNECGTDTWSAAHPCRCLQCLAWLAERRIAVLSPEEQRRRWADAFAETAPTSSQGPK
jgi:hypothetical protein